MGEPIRTEFEYKVELFDALKDEWYLYCSNLSESEADSYAETAAKAWETQSRIVTVKKTYEVTRVVQP